MKRCRRAFMRSDEWQRDHGWPRTIISMPAMSRCHGSEQGHGNEQGRHHRRQQREDLQGTRSTAWPPREEHGSGGGNGDGKNGNDEGGFDTCQKCTAEAHIVEDQIEPAKREPLDRPAEVRSAVEGEGTTTATADRGRRSGHTITCRGLRRHTRHAPRGKKALRAVRGIAPA